MTESHKSQEFSNEHLKVKVTYEPLCVVRFEVLVSPLATESAFAKAKKTVAKDISLPGFRKGKAPVQLVEERFKTSIQSSFKEILVNTTFQDTVKLTNLYPFNNNTIGDWNVGKIAPGEEATIKFKFEHYPEVPSINPQELKLKKVNPPTVNEESIQEVMDKIQRHHAEVTEVLDRSVEEGDEVEVQIELMNPSLNTPQIQMARYDLRAQKVDEELMKLLLHAKVGDEIDAKSALKGGEADEKSSCKITVKRIRKLNLPELNDDLAKKAGAENLEELNKKIVKSLENQLEESITELKREEIQMRLLQAYPFDLPASLLKKEQNRRFLLRLENLKTSHLKEEEIENLKPQVEKETLLESENYIRLQYLIFKFIDENKIVATQEDIAQEMVREMMHDRSAMQLKGEELRERAHHMITAKKALDTMISNAVTEE